MINISLSYVIIHSQKVFVLTSETSDKYILIYDDYISELDEVEFTPYKSKLHPVHTFAGYLGSIPVTVSDTLVYVGFYINSSTQVGVFDKTAYFKITDVVIVYFDGNNLCAYSSSDKNFVPSSDAIKNIIEVARLISNGLFYFAVDTNTLSFFNLSSRTDYQDSSPKHRQHFLWNRNMIQVWELSGIKHDLWITPVINGSIDIQSIICNCSRMWDKNANSDKIAQILSKIKYGECMENKSSDLTPIRIQILLISRLSWVRVGARFNVRGINDDGFVANYVETEQVFFSEGATCAFRQIRGSVPMFWSQNGIQMGSHRINFDRNPACSFYPFYHHFKALSTSYKTVMIVNLLNQKKDEAIMGKYYGLLFKLLPPDMNCKMINYDYQEEFDANNTDAMWAKMPELVKFLTDNRFFVGFKINENMKHIQTQLGVVRTNCIDCLDRTNAMQTAIGIMVSTNQLESIGINNVSTSTYKRIEEVLRGMWFINGNNCSLNYAGTSALEKTKSNVTSIIRDSAVSIKRAFVNNFLDAKRNFAISFLSGYNQHLLNLPPLYCNLGWCFLPCVFRTDSKCPTELLLDLLKRNEEYVECSNISVTVGTWNVNGGVEKSLSKLTFFNKSLQEWLLFPQNVFPQFKTNEFTHNLNYSADVIVVGFQEIVDLTASNIIKTSPEHMELWAKALQEYISKDSPYLLVASDQLVGVCLFMFAHQNLIPYIRDVSTRAVKTGLGGTTGNKGAIGISCTIKSSKYCFVCAHFAAGSGAGNLNQRNQDFADICSQMVFDGEKSINSHDVVFWCGDLNYRVNLTSDNAKFLASNNNIQELLEKDQLSSSMAEQKVFSGFKEGPINFLPTYKYDIGSDRYDSSEKNRVPSWTDRILWWESPQSVPHFREHVTQLYYGRAESRASDHRPVVSLFISPVKSVNPNKLFICVENLLDTCTYLFQTIRFVCSLKTVTFEEISLDVKYACELFDGVKFYRVYRNMFYLTFANGKRFQDLPKLVNLNNRKFYLEIVPTLNLKNSEKYVLESLKELCSTYNKNLLKNTGLDMLSEISFRATEIDDNSYPLINVGNDSNSTSKPPKPPKPQRGSLNMDTDALLLNNANTSTNSYDPASRRHTLSKNLSYSVIIPQNRKTENTASYNKNASTDLLNEPIGLENFVHEPAKFYIDHNPKSNTFNLENFSSTSKTFINTNKPATNPNALSEDFFGLNFLTSETSAKNTSNVKPTNTDTTNSNKFYYSANYKS